MSIVLIRYTNLVLVTLFILSLFSFFLAYLFPGQAVENLTGLRLSELTVQQINQIKYTVDGNIFEQYMQYMGELFAGNWGVSFTSGLPLFTEIGEYLPASIELSTYALFLSFTIGLPLGFLAALRHHKATDYSLLSISLLGYSIPVFWLALIVILVFQNPIFQEV